MAKMTRFLPALALSALAFAPMAHAEGETADTVVAVVDGTEITLGHMIVVRDRLPAEYQSLPNDVLFKGILDQLVQQTALAQSVKDVPYRHRIAMENDRRGYMASLALQAVGEGAVTDAALQAAYDARYKDASPATEYRASHILVDTQEKAAELKAQIDGGADFGALAQANSSDGSAANGGDLGWFGLGMMVKPFEEAVIALQPGAVSDPVQTQFGWHLVKLVETRNAEVPGLDDVRDELATQIEQQAIAAHIQTLIDAATITRPGEGIDAALLRDQTLIEK
jgi:peptidyl-prolyl cis-trans isomerase C